MRICLRTTAPAGGLYLSALVFGFAGWLLGTTLGVASPPVHPTFKSHWPGYGAGRAWDVQVENGLAYVAIEDGGLLILDVNEPARPRQIGNLRLAGRGPLALTEPYAYLAANGLQVIDVRNPAQPIRVGGYDGLHISRIAATADYAYAAVDGLGLVVFDLSDKARP